MSKTPVPRLTAKCQTCKKEFHTEKRIQERGWGKFCSVKCRKAPFAPSAVTLPPPPWAAAQETA